MGSGLVLPMVTLILWLDNLLFLLLQYITHPAEQSVLIHLLWANVNFNSSGESECALVLCTSIGAGSAVVTRAARLLVVLLEFGCCMERAGG